MPENKTKRWYSQRLDPLFSKFIRSRGRCERCGARDTLQCAHVEGRDDKNLRWNENNALCLCDACHRWAHAHNYAFRTWFGLKFPDRDKIVRVGGGGVFKMTLDDYEALYQRYLEATERRVL